MRPAAKSRAILRKLLANMIRPRLAGAILVARPGNPRFTQGMMRTLFLLLSFVLLSGTALAGTQGDLRKVRIPVDDEFITVRYLLLDDGHRHPAVIINHGEEAGTSEAVLKKRRNYNLRSAILFGNVVAFWQHEGFDIVAPLRRGYGDSGSHYSGSFVSCSHPDFVTPGENVSREISSTISWIRQQDWFDGRIILTGSSGGGFASVYAATKNFPGVAGIISYSGFRGAVDPVKRKRHPCGEELQTGLYARAGAETAVPAMWIFAENDRLIDPGVVRKWADAYNRGSHGKLELLMFPPLHDQNGNEQDGHAIFRRPDLWGKEVENYLGRVMHRP
jgi:dienelactone hydrolase